MHTDHREYFKFTGRSRLEKSINSLLGIIEGISVDSIINGEEIKFLNLWLEEHQELQDRHPYSELLPVVKRAISDGELTTEEKEDILWLCEKLRSTEFFDGATADIQRLHAMLGGIASDGAITEAELKDVYTGEKQFSGSIKLVPVDNAAVHSEFLSKVMKMDAAVYGALWIKKSFRAGLTTPKVKSGDAEIYSFIHKTPGAIGYVNVPVAGEQVLHKY